MTSSTQLQPPTLISLITASQLAHSISDEQLAEMLGYERSNTIAMIKTGAVKLPARKVLALAAALAIDASHLFNAYLEETIPELLLGAATTLTPQLLTLNELKLVNDYRFLCKGREVVPTILDGSSIIALIAV